MQKKTKPIAVEKKTDDIKNDEWKNQYLRALADYHNLEKRYEAEFVQQKIQANKRLLTKLLSVIDNIERAEVFVNDQGLKIVKEEFFKILKDEGVEEIEVLNKIFDPYTAECIEVVPGENDDIIVAVVRKGFKLHETILRPAQVKVSKKLPVDVKN